MVSWHDGYDKLSRALIWITAGLLGGVSLSSAQTIEVEIAPTADTSIYQDADNLSNGAGVFSFVGRIDNGLRRRALIRFADLSAIPNNAVIQAVEVRLWLSRKRMGAGPITIFAHRLTSDWGESTSDALIPGGMGALAAIGDATWANTFFPDQQWNTAGGDFDAEVSSSAFVNDIGAYVWSDSAKMRADFTGWLSNPSSNYGWIFLDSLTSPLRHARRFNTREINDVPTQPRLIVRYELALFRDGFEE